MRRTSLDLDTIRASALASLVARKYKRLPFHALTAIAELQGLAPERRLAAIDTAIGLGWLEECPTTGEVIAPSPLDQGEAA